MDRGAGQGRTDGPGQPAQPRTRPSPRQDRTALWVKAAHPGRRAASGHRTQAGLGQCNGEHDPEGHDTEQCGGRECVERAVAGGRPTGRDQPTTTYGSVWRRPARDTRRRRGGRGAQPRPPGRRRSHRLGSRRGPRRGARRAHDGFGSALTERASASSAGRSRDSGPSSCRHARQRPARPGGRAGRRR